MPATLETLFRTLSAFAPERADLSGADWDTYVDWAIGQGLAPLAAYNLEYRLGGAGAPEWARDRLLSIYQGSLNDNVMKLVNFKRAVDELEGRRIVLLGAASHAEALYPHVAFRPVIDLHCLVPPADVGPFASFLARSEFKPEGETGGASQLVSDGRTRILVSGALFATGDQGLLARAVPFKVYGPSFLRLAHEDAVLAHVAALASTGFDVPAIEWVDLRELVLGAQHVMGPYSRALDGAQLKARAAELGVEQALWAALEVVQRLFPETAAVASAAQPELPEAVREGLVRSVVGKAAVVGAPGR